MDRDEVQQKRQAGASLVEVLPARDYEWAHLPGAISMPLDDLTGAAADAVLDASRPVVVYCNDFQ